MYESFFKLNARPFITTPSADRYFPAASCEEAHQRLARCIGRGEGPALLVGRPGLGKSMLCQLLAEEFRGTHRVALLTSARLCTRRALLQAILFELNLPFRDKEEGELRLSFIDFVKSNVCQQGLVLLVDEAHTLPLRLVEEIRMMTNVARDGRPRVHLVLAGLPILEERFAAPQLESLNQRLAARCYLESFNREETGKYVARQIELCGGAVGSIFTADALEAIYEASDGIPRLINQLCDHTLLLAAAGGVKPIDAAGIQEAWADLQQLPAPWHDTPAPSDEAEASVIEFGALSDDFADPESRLDSVERAVEQELNPEPSRFEPQASEEADEAEPRDPREFIEEPFEEEVEEEVDEAPQPATSAPTLYVVSDPFAETFEQEEVILDHYAALDGRRLASHPRVSSLEGKLIAGAIASLGPPPVEEAAESEAEEDSEIAEVEFSHATLPLKSAGGLVVGPGRTPRRPEPVAEEEGSLPPGELTDLRRTEPLRGAGDLERLLGEAERIAAGEAEEESAEIPDEIDAVYPEPEADAEARRDDRDLIELVEEEPVPQTTPATVERQEYRRLFAQLRRR